MGKHPSIDLNNRKHRRREDQDTPRTNRDLIISQTRRIRNPVTSVTRTGIPRTRYSTTHFQKDQCRWTNTTEFAGSKGRLPKELEEFTEVFCKKK
jgi:hypothetical protein